MANVLNKTLLTKTMVAGAAALTLAAGVASVPNSASAQVYGRGYYGPRVGVRVGPGFYGPRFGFGYRRGFYGPRVGIRVGPGFYGPRFGYRFGYRGPYSYRAVF